MTKDRKSETREERISRIKSEAGERIAKRGKLGVRFTEAEIDRIQKFAAENGVRVMPMLYDWIMKRLSFEETVHKDGKSKNSSTYASGSKAVPTVQERVEAYDTAAARADDVLRQIVSIIKDSGYFNDTTDRRAKSK